MQTQSRNRWLDLAPSLLLALLLFAHVAAPRSIVFIVTVITAIYVWRSSSVPPIPLVLPLALWGGMGILSLAWAHDLAYSLGEIKAEIAYGMLYFVSFFILTDSRKRWVLFRTALLVGLLAMGALAVFIYLRDGTLNTDNSLGGVLIASTQIVTLFPLLLLAVFEQRKLTPIFSLHVCAIVIALAVGYLTFIRNFILAIDATGIAVAVLLIHQGFRTRGKLTMFLLAIVVAIGLSGFFLYSVAKHRVGTSDLNTTVETTIGKDPRWDIWEFSVERIRQHPFTGTGFGRFSTVDLFRKQFPAEILHTHAHNPFLNYMLEMGIGGLLVLLFLLFSLLSEFWKLWKSDNQEVKVVGIAGLAMVMGVVLKTQTDDIWTRQSGYLFWAVTGMMMGYAHRLREKTIPDTINP